MTCAIYIRKSREDQSKPGHRLTAQREQLPTYAKAQGWQVEVYDDGHASAARGKAESLTERNRLEADIRAGRINTILTIELSRLSRDDSLQDYVAWLDLCSRYLVKLATPSRTLDPAQHSDWMLLLMEGGFSSVEMKVLQQRMAEGRRQAFVSGKYLAGNPPIPYTYDKQIGGLRVDPATLPVAKKVFELSPTHSTRDVAKETGLPVSAIRRMTSDDRLLMYQALRHDPETGQIINCEWPAVIDQQQADQIKAGRTDRRRGYKRRHAAGILSNLGLFICGHCGKSIRAWKNGRPRKDGTRLDYYGCRSKDGQDLCKPSRMIPQQIIDPLVLGNLTRTLKNVDQLKAAWHKSQTNDATARELKQLNKQETESKQKVDRIVSAITEGVISNIDAKLQRIQIENKLSAIRQKRQSLLRQLQQEPNWEDIALTKEEIDHLAFDETRTLVRSTIKKILLFNKTMFITYRFPRNQKGDRKAQVKLPEKQTASGPKIVYTLKTDSD